MKTLKAFRFGIIAILIMFAAAFNYASQKEPDGSVQNHQKSSAITKEILKILDERQFITLALDDALSSKLLDNYIDRLDPNKAFFYQADISEFNQYRTILDDQLKNGDDSAGFIIYDRFRQRIEDRLQKVIALLQDDQTIFDFTKDESLNTDTANNTWLESIDDGDGYWRKRIKSFLLSQKLSGDSPDKSRQQLEKRYINQLARVQKNSDDEVYEIYINSLTELYDPHTNYLAPRTSENFNINMSLSLEGIGAVLQTEDEHTKVVRVVTGGPAQKQGELKASDKITAVAQHRNKNRMLSTNRPQNQLYKAERNWNRKVYFCQSRENGGNLGNEGLQIVGTTTTFMRSGPSSVLRVNKLNDSII